jgi:hypothetical protein
MGKVTCRRRAEEAWVTGLFGLTDVLLVATVSTTKYRVCNDARAGQICRRRDSDDHANLRYLQESRHSEAYAITS